MIVLRMLSSLPHPRRSLLACLIGAALLAAGGGAAAAHAGPSLSAAGKKAFAALVSADRFAPGAVGYGGAPSPESQAFRVLLKEADAGAAFSELFAQGTAEGRLYGLAGLYFTDGARFRREAAWLARSKGRVDAQFGCAGLSRPVGELVRSAKKNAIRVPSGSTMAAWFKKHRSGALDFVGGGYPLELAGPGARAP